MRRWNKDPIYCIASRDYYRHLLDDRCRSCAVYSVLTLSTVKNILHSLREKGIGIENELLLKSNCGAETGIIWKNRTQIVDSLTVSAGSRTTRTRMTRSIEVEERPNAPWQINGCRERTISKTTVTPKITKPKASPLLVSASECILKFWIYSSIVREFFQITRPH